MNLMQIAQMLRASQNPETALRQMANQNPMAAQALKIIEGKNPQQINQIAANMARERGMDYNQFTQQIKQTLGL